MSLWLFRLQKTENRRQKKPMRRRPGRDLPIDSRRVAYRGGPKNEDATALRQLPFHSASCHSASLAAIIIIMITTITTALIAVVIAAAFLPSCPIECPCGG